MNQLKYAVWLGAAVLGITGTIILVKDHRGSEAEPSIQTVSKTEAPAISEEMKTPEKKPEDKPKDTEDPRLRVQTQMARLEASTAKYRRECPKLKELQSELKEKTRRIADMAQELVQGNSTHDDIDAYRILAFERTRLAMVVARCEIDQVIQNRK